MKVFRKVTPGANPDITVHAELTRGRVRAHRRALRLAGGDGPGDPEGGVLQLAMLQQFLRTATDGFELALAQRPVLFADAGRGDDVHAPSPAATSPPRRPARRGAARGARRAARRTSRPRPARPAAAAELAAQMTDRLAAALDRRPRPRARTPTRCARSSPGRAPSTDCRPADPRRPAPGPDPAHRVGLEDRRLRGRARQAAGRAAAARLPLARRRRDAAQLRLRPARRRARDVRGRRADGRGRACRARRRSNGPSATRTTSSTAYAGGALTSSSRPCWTPTSRTRPSTRPSTRPATARPGWTVPLQAVARIGAA